MAAKDAKHLSYPINIDYVDERVRNMKWSFDNLAE